jgi:hypothetical protein
MNYQKTFAVAAGIATLGAASFAFALTPQDYSLFGDASYTVGNASPRAVHLVSDSAPGYGGIDYTIDAGTTFGSLTALSSDYKLEADDACVGGSPRFQINVIDPNTNTEKNIFAYFGVDSAGAPCVPGVWSNTGDMLEVNRLLDTSQLTGGTFYDPYASALTKYGSWTVTGIQVVTDSGWAATDGEHAVDIDNTLIDTTLFTYEVPTATSKDQCKNGGWQNFNDGSGNGFKNQGDCVSYVASKGKNGGNN